MPVANVASKKYKYYSDAFKEKPETTNNDTSSAGGERTSSGPGAAATGFERNKSAPSHRPPIASAISNRDNAGLSNHAPNPTAIIEQKPHIPFQRQ